MYKFVNGISLIGAGNVASHLAVHFQARGIEVKTISSRNNDSARILAAKIKSIVIEDLSSLPAENLVLICVNDEEIESVINQLPIGNSIIYTSGNVAIDSLPKRENLGVLYPLQTFSKGQAMQLSNVPFLIEANNSNFGKIIYSLACKLSCNVSFADSVERQKLHLGAVFVNNFTNHLFYLAKKYIDDQHLNWEVLSPLLAETFRKLEYMDPFDAQTGPARRNDLKTIQNHLNELDGKSKEIYDILSKSIIETYQSK